MLYVVEWIPAATLVRVSPVCILIHLLCAFFASCAKGERVESIVIPHPIYIFLNGFPDFPRASALFVTTDCIVAMS